jgi:hypothetical protein
MDTILCLKLTKEKLNEIKIQTETILKENTKSNIDNNTNVRDDTTAKEDKDTIKDTIKDIKKDIDKEILHAKLKDNVDIVNDNKNNNKLDSKLYTRKIKSYQTDNFTLIKKKNEQKPYNNFVDDPELIDNFVKETKTFSDNETWPLRTCLRCWHCSLRFDTIPIGIPNKKIGTVVYTEGCTCSFNCCLAYILNMKTTDADRYERITILYYLKQRMTGHTSENIIPSPSKEILREYGGNMTRKEYKESVKHGTISTCLNFYPLVNVGYCYDHTNYDNIIDNSGNYSGNNSGNYSGNNSGNNSGNYSDNNFGNSDNNSSNSGNNSSNNSGNNSGNYSSNIRLNNSSNIHQKIGIKFLETKPIIDENKSTFDKLFT